MIAEIDTEFYCLHTNRQTTRTRQTEIAMFPDRDPGHSDELNSRSRELNKAVDRLRFSILLASEGEILTTYDVYKTVANPMTHVGACLPAELPHNNSAHELTSDVCMNFEDWIEVVTRMPDHLNSPMRQLLRAARCTSSNERLLAAVTTWDALLGSYPESGHPTTTQISLLLEPEDPTSRTSLELELSTIYAARADIVYGVTDPYENDFDDESATTVANRALQVALDTFRRILVHPTLSTLPDSKSRSRALSTN